MKSRGMILYRSFCVDVFFEKQYSHTWEEGCHLHRRKKLSPHEEVHIPGSVLVSLRELADRVEEFETGKPAIVYCASGGRSRAGTSILLNAGFREVYNLKGGIHAREGDAAQGDPEYGTAYFSDAAGATDFIAPAWALEEGMKLNDITTFLGDKRDIDVIEYAMALEAQLYDLYLRLKRPFEDGAILGVIDTLASAERKHINMLTDLHRDMS